MIARWISGRAARVLIVASIAATRLAAQDGGPKRWTVNDVMAVKGVGEVAVSPDGKRIAYVVTERNTETNVTNSDVWVVSVTGGDARRVTSGPRADRAPQWANDGSWIAFLSDRADNKLTQVYGIDPAGGEAWQISRHESSVESYKLSPDAKRVAYVASAPASRAEQDLDKARGKAIVRDSAYAADFSRLWEVVLKDRAPADGRAISPEGLHVTSVVWGPDSRVIAYSARPQPALVASSRGTVYLQSEPGAESRAITTMPGNEEVAGWPAALGLVVQASGEAQGTANTRVWVVPIIPGDAVSLTDALDEDATFVAATATEVLVEASVKTGRALFRIPLAQGKPSGPPLRVSSERFNAGFNYAGGTIAFISETGTESPEVYATTASFSARKLTNTNPQVASFGHGAQRVVNWKSSADTQTIEGVLSLPVGYQEGTRVPLLVVVHGGPAGVSSARYPSGGSAYPVQVFNSMGYAVLQPNFRGSTGYGQRFRGLNQGDILGKDWIDVNSGVDAMIRTGIADSTKMGLMGWSYGGFQTFWGITQTRRFAAASSGAGVNDLTSFFSQTDISDYLGMLMNSVPWDKPEFFVERSAYRKVKDVTTPLLIQSGDQDRRVSPEQSIQFYEAMKRIGKTPVKLVLYPGQGHGISDPRLAKDRMLRNVEWFSYWVPVVGQKPVIRMN